jgi:RNA polymerase sigma factor for flagellar operon FliA
MNIKRDDAELIQQYCSSKSAALREEIILRYVPLVHYVLGRLGISQSLGADYEDAAGQGLLGLIEAVDRYDPTYGTQFSTYATLRIRGKALDHLRSGDWLSRGARKRARLVQDGVALLWERNQSMPSDQELALHLGLELFQVQQALVDSSRLIISLDAANVENGDQNNPLHEFLADEHQPEPSLAIEESEVRTALAEALQELPRRDQLILSLYYNDELTFKEIGAVLDISESRVCQLHTRLVVALQAQVRNKLQTHLKESVYE